jgi:hypothetical protein
VDCTSETAGGVVGADGGVVDDGAPVGVGVGVGVGVEVLVAVVVPVVVIGVGAAVVVEAGGVDGGVAGLVDAGGLVGEGDGAGPVVEAIGVGSAAALAVAGARITKAIGRATTLSSDVRALDPRGTLRK